MDAFQGDIRVIGPSKSQHSQRIATFLSVSSGRFQLTTLEHVAVSTFGLLKSVEAANSPVPRLISLKQVSLRGLTSVGLFTVL